MLDYRVQTFITLCETMNYRITAQKLNMTQPAVTQHIKYMEHQFGCKLFNYNGKILTKTKSATILEQHLRTMNYNQNIIHNILNTTKKVPLKIGATKTVGGFVINDMLISYLKNTDNLVEFIVDNTSNLLSMLKDGKLDFAVIEGYFDKGEYESKVMQSDEFFGICSKEHKFANKTINIDEIFNETIIVREEGSGTREILQQILHRFNYNISNFERTILISNFLSIISLVKSNVGISFVYKSIPKADKDLAIFRIKNVDISREFNYVYLKNSIGVKEKINEFEKIKRT